MTNREKYKDINKRTAKFREFCRSHENCTNCETHAYQNISTCAYAWEEMEAEEELLPCPFCGGESSIRFTRKSWVECNICGSRTRMCDCDSVAIEEWNRITND